MDKAPVQRARFADSPNQPNFPKKKKKKNRKRDHEKRSRSC